ncbi:MAG: phosphoglycolate phosphatase [Tabrizicola sp.]|nr:phosphoglycolate phosphatase [Tabrizicola sp.]
MARTSGRYGRQPRPPLAKTLNLVFDLDGTLIDSAADIHAAANNVFQNNGLKPSSYQTVRGFIGNGVGVLVSRLLVHQGMSGDGDLHQELVAQFVKNYEEAFDLTTLYPETLAALESLAANGHQLAICTNKPEVPTRAALRHFGLDRFFRVIVGGDSLAERKPHPAPLLAAVAELGPAKSLFVGDSEVDAETARAAGIPFALFTGGYRKATVEQLGAKVIFDHHSALPGLVAHLSERL